MTNTSSTQDIENGRDPETLRLLLESVRRLVDDVLIPAGDDLAFQVTGFWSALTAVIGGQGSGSEDEDAVPMEAICYRIP